MRAKLSGHSFSLARGDSLGSFPIGGTSIVHHNSNDDRQTSFQMPASSSSVENSEHYLNSAPNATKMEKFSASETMGLKESQTLLSFSNSSNSSKTEMINPPSTFKTPTDTSTVFASNESKIDKHPPKKRLSLFDMAEAATIELERHGRLSLESHQAPISSSSTSSTPANNDDDDNYHNNNNKNYNKNYALVQQTIRPESSNALPFGQFTKSNYEQTNLPSAFKEGVHPIKSFQTLFTQVGCATQRLMNKQENIHNNISSPFDATEAAIKAVRIAIDLCCTNPLPVTKNNNDLCVKIKLGVPSEDHKNTINYTMIPTTSACLSNSYRPMYVNLLQVSKSISNIGKVLPINVVTGGLLWTDDDPNNNNTSCAVIAHVSLGYEKGQIITDHYSSANKGKRESDFNTANLSSSLNETNNKPGHSQTLNTLIGQNEIILRENMELESKIDILQKRLALRDESIELLAKNGDNLKLQLQHVSHQQQHSKNPYPQGQQQANCPSNEFYQDCQGQFAKNTNHTTSNANKLSTQTLQRPSISPIPTPNVSRSPHNSPMPPSNNVLCTQHTFNTTATSTSNILENRININTMTSTFNDSRNMRDFITANEDATPDDSSLNTMSDRGIFLGKKRNLSPGLTAKEHLRQFVQHKYHDYSNEPISSSQSSMVEDSSCDDKKRKRMNSSFPKKLHSLLNEVAIRGEEDIVSWRPHGRAFIGEIILIQHESNYKILSLFLLTLFILLGLLSLIVHKPKAFVEKIMSRHFLLTKYCSFLRQLNLYGFHRFSTGVDKGAYYHELFLRGMPFLCDRMVRTRVNGNGIRSASNPDSEPNFYQMAFIPVDHATKDTVTTPPMKSSPVTVIEEDVDDDLTEESESVNGDGKSPPSSAFPLKLHFMLDKIEESGRSDIVSWQPHNRSFLVHNADAFARDVMPNFFRQTKYSSFQRQLHMYGFQRISAGPDKGAYYHECFIRGKPSLCNHMVRKRVNGKGCRQPSNPSKEPNFYDMNPIILEKSDKPDTIASLDQQDNNKSRSGTPSLFPSTQTVPNAGVAVAQT